MIYSVVLVIPAYGTITNSLCDPRLLPLHHLILCGTWAAGVLKEVPTSSRFNRKGTEQKGEDRFLAWQRWKAMLQAAGPLDRPVSPEGVINGRFQ